MYFISWREAYSSTGRLVTGGTVERDGGTENKIEHNSLNFRARSPKFCMEVHMDSRNKVQKYKSTKYKTKKFKMYKNAKKCKKCKNVKNIKSTKSTKVQKKKKKQKTNKTKKEKKNT